jgi:hypothetical protein
LKLALHQPLPKNLQSIIGAWRYKLLPSGGLS